MPDAIEMLMADHREVEQLFERYESGRDPSVVRQVCTELTVHAALEEKVVYPLLGSRVTGGKDMRRHAEHEHQQVKDAIFAIERLGYDNPGVDEHMRTIISGVKEHVQEEEGDVLPKMREQLSDDQLSKLTEQARTTKEELLGAARSAGPLIDLTKDKLYELAQEKHIAGRSEMTKEQLISALQKT